MAAKTPIYLDHNATTPLDPRVLEAMMPYLTTEFGNAGSRSHVFGRRAAEAVERAREQVARLIGATPEEIIFTSGATESNNLALKGVAESYADRGRHIVTGQTEHKAILDVCRDLGRRGCEITCLRPNQFGRISAAQVEEALHSATILVTLMAANNETGTLHPLAEIGKVAKRRGVIFHCDAAQAVGRVPLDVAALGMDLLSLSAHKFHGPKGVGALYVRRRSPRVRLESQTHGGGQEHGLRSGTLNVPGIVGLGAATEICTNERAVEAERLARFRERLHRLITRGVSGVSLNGHPDERLPNTLSLSFAYVEAEALMARLAGVAVSSGSACTSAQLTPSHVLKAMGVPAEAAHGTIRFSLGRFNTVAEIDRAGGAVVAAVKELRPANPLYAAATGGKCNCRGGCSSAG